MSEIRPLILTYNCGRELVKPAVFSNHIVSAFPQISPELIAIALEEVAPISYSFLGGSFLTSYLDRVTRTVDLTARKWGDYTYQVILTRNLGMTALMVFARSDVRESIVQIEAAGVGVGYQEMGNKGAVAARLAIRSTGSQDVVFTFVSAHLAPMEGALDRRNEDWKRIVRGLTFRPVRLRTSKGDAALDAERERLLADNHSENLITPELYSTYGKYGSTLGSHLIVAGDLNYRTADAPPRPYARAGFPQLSAEADSPHHHSKLLPSDQLSREVAAGRAFQGLTEAKITFPPTYKYSKTAQREMALLEDDDLKPGSIRDEAGNIGIDAPSLSLDFPWAGHRWPSWCDRILWLPTGTDDQVKALKYTSLKLMSTSDHQPVALHLSIPLRPVSLDDDSDLRRHPPFDMDPQSTARRLTARRKEIIVGGGAFMVMTLEGRAILAAILVGAMGGWILMSRLVK